MINKKYIHRFTVAGAGKFPLDMLRRDHCWPACETDAAIASYEGGLNGERRVTLSHGVDRYLWHPTYDRWASFGWDVVKHDMEPVEEEEVVKLPSREEMIKAIACDEVRRVDFSALEENWIENRIAEIEKYMTTAWIQTQYKKTL